MTIPKIIHQIAPLDKSRWHPLWFRCQESWSEHFKDFQYKLWNDEEDIDSLVKDHFSEYYKFYIELPVHIMKIDFARFCILYYHGGIYADMDMFCYKNFYHELTKKVYVLEAPYGDVFLENALMASTKQSQFFKQCIDKSVERYNTHVKNKFNKEFYHSKKDQLIITSACGPHLVCSVFREFDKSNLSAFSGLTYNNHGLSYHPAYNTKHLMTGLWGKESIDNIKNNSSDDLYQEYSNNYIKEVSQYANLNIKNIDEFDFYKDYTNGGYLKSFILDYDKNNIDNDPQTNKFSYN